MSCNNIPLPTATQDGSLEANTNALNGLTIVSAYEPLSYRFTAYAGKLHTHRAELPGSVDIITGSAFLLAPAAGRRGI